MNVVIGKSLADAQEFASKWNVAAPFLISPRSISPRIKGVTGGQMYVTPDAFSHPWIRPTVQTVQRVMHKRQT